MEEPSVKDIFEMRREGRVVEAYEAIRRRYAVHHGHYTTICMFWCAADMMSLLLENATPSSPATEGPAPASLPSAVSPSPNSLPEAESAALKSLQEAESAALKSLQEAESATPKSLSKEESASLKSLLEAEKIGLALERLYPSLRDEEGYARRRLDSLLALASSCRARLSGR